MEENSSQAIGKERVLTEHTKTYWQRREAERRAWDTSRKIKRKPKQLAAFNGTEVDQELVETLLLLHTCGLTTQFSCAGVSLLDEPVDHSLYAYVTLMDTPQAMDFILFVKQRMRHRVLISHEPEKNRYDISSFFIGHNRSFCLLLYYSCLDYSRKWAEAVQEQKTQ